MNLPEKPTYSRQEMERARTTAQVVGWAQGAGVVVGGVLLLKLLGWIPAVLVLGGVIWVLYKLLKPKSEE